MYSSAVYYGHSTVVLGGKEGGRKEGGGVRSGHGNILCRHDTAVHLRLYGFGLAGRCQCRQRKKKDIVAATPQNRREKTHAVATLVRTSTKIKIKRYY